MVLAEKGRGPEKPKNLCANPTRMKKRNWENCFLDLSAAVSFIL
jgi:hypothetical protein